MFTTGYNCPKLSLNKELHMICKYSRGISV